MNRTLMGHDRRIKDKKLMQQMTRAAVEMR
jgi:hypothetical protein